MKLKTPRAFFEKYGDAARLHCSTWPKHDYFELVFMGKLYCLGVVYQCGYGDGWEIFLRLDEHSPEIFYSLYKKPKKKKIIP